MKKLFTLLFAIAFSTQILSAQDNVLSRGSQLWNVGLGITQGGLPLSVSYEYGVLGNIFDQKSALGVGAYGGLLLGTSTTAFTIGPQVAFHYHFLPNLDAYAKLLLAYNTYVNEFLWGSHLGARYLMTSRFGLFAETGYGLSFLNVGVSFKL